MLASMAPSRLRIHRASPLGNGCFVTCASIIRPTWCANCRPHAHRKGRKTLELITAEREKSGARSQKICTATLIGKGRRCKSGLKGLWRVASFALQTLK